MGETGASLAKRVRLDYFAQRYKEGIIIMEPEVAEEIMADFSTSNTRKRNSGAIVLELAKSVLRAKPGACGM